MPSMSLSACRMRRLHGTCWVPVTRSITAQSVTDDVLLLSCVRFAALASLKTVLHGGRSRELCVWQRSHVEIGYVGPKYANIAGYCRHDTTHPGRRANPFQQREFDNKKKMYLNRIDPPLYVLTRNR